MSNPLYQRHVISIADLTRHDLETVIATAQQLKREPRTDLLKDKVVASCFFEASTRTRLSFETAVQRLGGTVIGFDDGGNTSLAKKGETMADSVRIITSYVDAFVMRHPKDGAARLASENSSVPVINGGDGSNQHPSQTLLDLFTIHETQGKLDGLTLAFVGDLNTAAPCTRWRKPWRCSTASFTLSPPKRWPCPTTSASNWTPTASNTNWPPASKKWCPSWIFCT